MIKKYDSEENENDIEYSAHLRDGSVKQQTNDSAASISAEVITVYQNNINATSTIITQSVPQNRKTLQYS